MIVENRPAGAGHLGMDFVAKAPPDGYTLLVTADAAFVVNQHLYSKLSYDPINDFMPISGLGISPQALLLHPSVPANTFSELVAYAKTKPGELNYGTFGIGTSGHLNIIHLESETGTKFTPVHYRGAAPAITDLLGGHIQMMIVAIGLLQQNLQAGKLKALGIGAGTRLPQYPDLPALAESAAGLRWPARGMASRRPRARRSEIVDKLSAETQKSVRRSGVPRQISRARRDVLDRQPAGAVRRAHAPPTPPNGARSSRTPASRWSDLEQQARCHRPRHDPVTASRGDYCDARSPPARGQASRA